MQKSPTLPAPYGADVPFMRPADLADDFTGTAAVIQHALHSDALDQRFDYACCLYATAPLLQARYLRQGLELLRAAAEKSFAFSVCSFGFPVQRALLIDSDGSLGAMHPEFRSVAPRICPRLSGRRPVLLGPQRGLAARRYGVFRNSACR